MSFRTTRSNQSNWLIGSGNDKSLDIGVKLPTNSLVLRRYHHLRELGSVDGETLSVRDVFKVILEELNVIWMRAGIPVKTEKKCLDQLVSLYQKWLSVKKIDHSKRQSGPTTAAQKRLEAFNVELEKLCDISALDAFDQLKASRRPSWQEDWDFLINQRKVPQVGLMQGLDSTLMQKEKRAAKRNERRSVKLIKEDIVHSIEESESEENSENEMNEFLPSPKKKTRPSTITLELPVRHFSKELGQVADRCVISNRKQLQIQSRMIVAAGGDVRDFSLSVSTIRRQRRENRSEVYRLIREKWSETKPSHVIVHWDSKLIQHLTGRSAERIAVLVSGGDELKTPKLLGIPPAENATGSTQKSVVVNLLEEWDVLDTVIGLVFDTTASNTGIRNGCAKLIENELKHPILWLACRHHVYELHIRHVWFAIAGSANSPVEPLLKRFQNDWDQLDHEPTDLQFFEWEESSELVRGEAESTLRWAENCLEKSSFPREDDATQ